MAHQKQEMFGQHLEYVYVGVWSNREMLKMDTVSRDSQNNLWFFSADPVQGEGTMDCNHAVYFPCVLPGQ